MRDGSRRETANRVINCVDNRNYSLDKVEQIEYQGLALTNKGDEKRDIVVK